MYNGRRNVMSERGDDVVCNRCNANKEKMPSKSRESRAEKRATDVASACSQGFGSRVTVNGSPSPSPMPPTRRSAPACAPYARAQVPRCNSRI